MRSDRCRGASVGPGVNPSGIDRAGLTARVDAVPTASYSSNTGQYVRVLGPADDGPPVEIVIYPDRDHWRYSIRTTKALMCGRLPAVTATDSNEVARNEATGLVLEYFGIGLEIEWAPAEEPGWWTGTVTRLEGQPL
jgi:hypothetical protein